MTGAVTLGIPMPLPSPKYPLALLTLLALAPLQALPALAHDEPQKRTISLVATGAVKATPDKVDISTGVTSEAKSAREALDQNTEAMAKVVEALKVDGIEPKDIQTTNFSVSPVYEQRKEGTAPFVAGYRVTNAVRITVRDTKKLGAILDKVVSLGANQVDSIEPSKVSMMPDGLIDTFTHDEILDLVAYLYSRGDRNHKMFRRAKE